MKFPVILAAIAAALPFNIALAADNNDNTVIVTASRSAQTVDDALASVTVITAEDIANSQALAVEELLEGVAGVDLNNSGGYGKLTSVFMRGTESDHVAVLVDGVRIGSATSGSIAWADIPLSQIERIEIVRGPRSSLYGADAIGGVIQIFTKKMDGAKSGAAVGGGNNKTRRMNASVASQNGIVWHRISMERFSSDGINATDENFFSPEPDNDPYERNSFSARGGFAIKDVVSFEVNAQHSDSTSDFDSSAFSPNVSDFEQQLLSTTIKLKTGSSSQLKIQGSESRDSNQNYRRDGSVSPTLYDSIKTQYSIQSDIDFGKAGLVIAGIDYTLDTVDSSTSYSQTSRYNGGTFLQYSSIFDYTSIQLSARHDNNEWYDSETTGNISISGKFKPYTVIASYGSGFRAPAFNDLFWDDPSTAGFFVGNPELKPETSRSFEIGLRGNHGNFKWEVNAYRTSIEDLIAYSFPTVVNINKARIDGMEAILGTRFDGFGMNVNISALDPRDVETDNILPRRSKRMGKLVLSYKGSAGTAGIEGIYHGKRFDDTNNTIELDSYTVANLYSRLALSDSWSLNARVDNLFNKEYQTVNTYNQPGRMVFVSLQYQ